MAALAYKHEEIAAVPSGWRVRTVTRGSHQVRIAFPPGRRKKGSGKVVEILHPTSEANPSCIVSHKAKSNPAELLIFGNPTYVHFNLAGREYRTDGKTVEGKDGQKWNVTGSIPVVIAARKAWADQKKNPAKGTKFDVYGKKYRGETEAEAKKRALRDRSLRGQRAARKTFGKLNASLIDAIRMGDRVTFVDRFNQKRTGKAVMRSSSGGWVLNMGGAHGTPAVVHDDQIVKVVPRKSNSAVRMQVFHDPAIKKFTAAMYDPKFGNLYATGYTKKEAAKALREEWRKARKSGSWRNPSKLDKQRAARERAERIRDARRHPTNPRRRVARTYGRPNKDARMRSNPSETEEAVKLFESFHGKDAKSIVEKQVSAAIRLDYAALGELQKLIVRPPVGNKDAEFNFEGDRVTLASSPDGKQLYCIGGNQNLSKCLDAASLEKDLIDLGECVQVEYLARKIHANYQPVVYYHKMGEKTGDRPRLMFDKLRRQIFFVGGAYYIEKDKGVSPGIEN